MASRDAAILKHGADANRELLSAGPTVPQETAVALTGLSVSNLVNVHASAARAEGGVTPSLFLKELDGRKLIRASPWDLLHDSRLVLADPASLLLSLVHGIIVANPVVCVK